MSEIAFKAALYVLGFVGLAGLTIIWLRVWQLARGELVDLWRGGGAPRVIALTLVPLGAWSLYVWLGTIRRLLRCLTDPPCGPNKSAGWINLAIFGGIYLLVEIVLLPAGQPAAEPNSEYVSIGR